VSQGHLSNVRRSGGTGRTSTVSFHFEGTPSVFE